MVFVVFLGGADDLFALPHDCLAVAPDLFCRALQEARLFALRHAHSAVAQRVAAVETVELVQRAVSQLPVHPGQRHRRQHSGRARSGSCRAKLPGPVFQSSCLAPETAVGVGKAVVDAHERLRHGLQLPGLSRAFALELLQRLADLRGRGDLDIEPGRDLGEDRLCALHRRLLPGHLCL